DVIDEVFRGQRVCHPSKVLGLSPPFHRGAREPLSPLAGQALNDELGLVVLADGCLSACLGDCEDVLKPAGRGLSEPGLEPLFAALFDVEYVAHAASSRSLAVTAPAALFWSASGRDRRISCSPSGDAACSMAVSTPLGSACCARSISSPST